MLFHPLRPNTAYLPASCKPRRGSPGFTRADHVARPVSPRAQGIQDIAYFLNPSDSRSSLRRRRRADLRQLLRDVGEEQYDVDGGLRRHSVQVQDPTKP